MQANLKLKLQVHDRLGLMADVARVMAECALNIVAMEVAKAGATTEIFIEVEQGSNSPAFETIELRLGAIAQVLETSQIKALPQEKREKRFQVVLDTISDGILAIDEGGELAIINRVAKEMLGCDSDELTGRPFSELNLPDTRLLEVLEGKSYSNLKRHLLGPKGRVQLLATGKPILSSQGRIVGAVEVLQDMQGIRELASAVAQPGLATFSDLIGQSAAIRDAIGFAQKIAGTEGIVCIRGESGTGKELFAEAIHAASERSGPFVPLNCAALPETLLESELFGYVGGAFSGARKEGKAGLFEIAQDGTLFLDEIAEMPPGLQAKMLRVIQERKVRRVGGSKEIAVNARLVTATNRNLEKMVEEQRFREDLYYRINVFPIHIPPLRRRAEDLPLLVQHFLFQINSRLGKSIQSLTPEALAKLQQHNWPGNVRELRNVIERAAILSASEQIGADGILFSFELGKNLQTPTTAAVELTEPLAELTWRYEYRLIERALAQTSSIRQAAKLLGISHSALLKKLRKQPPAVVTD